MKERVLFKCFGGSYLYGTNGENSDKDYRGVFLPDIKDLILNGVSIGEIGIEVAIAGDYGVPLTMITADSAGVKEAENLVPGTIGISVKESLWHSGGACYSAKKTSRMIYDAAEQLVKNSPLVKPWKIEVPELTVVFNQGAYHEKFKNLYKMYK